MLGDLVLERVSGRRLISLGISFFGLDYLLVLIVNPDKSIFVF